MTENNATSDREIVVSRLVSAPRELVFEVWSRPEHLDVWFGPNGFRTETKSLDFRVGGAWVYTMTGADGKVYPNYVQYEEIEHPSVIRYKHGSSLGDEHSFDVTVTFADRNGDTEITLRSLFATKEARDYVVREVGAIEGAKQTLAKLGEAVSNIEHSRGVTTTTPGDNEIVMTRVFDAPRELLFKAWTDAEMLKNWWGPDHFTTRVTLDFRVGGKYAYTMVGPDGQEYPGIAEYKEIVPNEKLVYVDNFDMENPPVKDLLLTVIFEDFGGKTRLTTRTTLASKTDRDVLLQMGSREGWTQSLLRLEALITAPSR